MNKKIQFFHVGEIEIGFSDPKYIVYYVPVETKFAKPSVLVYFIYIYQYV